MPENPLRPAELPPAATPPAAPEPPAAQDAPHAPDEGEGEGEPEARGRFSAGSAIATLSRPLQARLQRALAEADIATARSYIEASRANSTRKAYAADWSRFCQWCRDRDAVPLPAAPALVAIYLAALAARGQAPSLTGSLPSGSWVALARGLAPPSIARALAAIAYAHLRAGHVPPHRAAGDRSNDGTVIAETLAGIRRSRTESPGRKDAADADVVMQLLWSIEGDGLAALRDRALIAFGMALAARRSELVALDVADLAWEPQGARVTIRRSKTDQEGVGDVVAVPEGRRLTPLG